MSFRKRSTNFRSSDVIIKLLVMLLLYLLLNGFDIFFICSILSKSLKNESKLCENIKKFLIYIIIINYMR